MRETSAKFYRAGFFVLAAAVVGLLVGGLGYLLRPKAAEDSHIPLVPQWVSVEKAPEVVYENGESVSKIVYYSLRVEFGKKTGGGEELKNLSYGSTAPAWYSDTQCESVGEVSLEAVLIAAPYSTARKVLDLEWPEGADMYTIHYLETNVGTLEK